MFALAVGLTLEDCGAERERGDCLERGGGEGSCAANKGASPRRRGVKDTASDCLRGARAADRWGRAWHHAAGGPIRQPCPRRSGGLPWGLARHERARGQSFHRCPCFAPSIARPSRGLGGLFPRRMIPAGLAPQEGLSISSVVRKGFPKTIPPRAAKGGTRRRCSRPPPKRSMRSRPLIPTNFGKPVIIQPRMRHRSCTVGLLSSGKRTAFRGTISTR
jgi:hypothetical protein